MPYLQFVKFLMM